MIACATRGLAGVIIQLSYFLSHEHSCIPSHSIPTFDPEPALTHGLITPIDPRTQFLVNMAQAFQMGLRLEYSSGSGSISGTLSLPVMEVNYGDGGSTSCPFSSCL
jgi:hypothetical protein